MRLVAISDLHGNLPDIPECDILLIAGDITIGRSPILQAAWLGNNFFRWLKKLPAKEIVGIAGNHDIVFQTHPGLVPDLPWHYLQDSSVVIGGLKIYGTPWQRIFYDWAFNLSEVDLAYRWSLIPEDTNILITHSPPLGYGDNTTRGESIGSPSLTARLSELNIQLAVFGHAHSGVGEWELDGTKLANVCVCDESYELNHHIFEIQID